MVELSILADEPYPALALILGGILSMFIAIYGRRDDSIIDEIGTIFAFILGAGMFLMAYVLATEGAVNDFTLGALIVLAVTLFLKPLKEIPWAALLGIAVGAAAAFVASLFLPSVVLGMDEWIILVIVFLVAGGITHAIFHFLEDVLSIASAVVSWKPVMILVGMVTMAEGVLLFLDTSIYSLL